MARQAKTLRQERAVLFARHGDPDNPASGTLLAKLHRLQEELQHVGANSYATLSSSLVGADASAATLPNRSADAIRREIGRVEEELDSIQKRIDVVDEQIAVVEAECEV